jgi:hypothetical protein
MNFTLDMDLNILISKFSFLKIYFITYGTGFHYTKYILVGWTRSPSPLHSYIHTHCVTTGGFLVIESVSPNADYSKYLPFFTSSKRVRHNTVEKSEPISSEIGYLISSVFQITVSLWKIKLSSLPSGNSEYDSSVQCTRKQTSFAADGAHTQDAWIPDCPTE